MKAEDMTPTELIQAMHAQPATKRAAVMFDRQQKQIQDLQGEIHNLKTLLSQTLRQTDPPIDDKPEEDFIDVADEIDELGQDFATVDGE